MHNDIISQNINLIDKKIRIEKDEFIKIKNILTHVYYVSREFESSICKECGCVVSKVKDYRMRKVKTFINYDYPILLYYKQRRLKCSCGKIMNENNSIVDHGKRISNYLRLEIL